MQKNLVIVESPAKAKTIEKFLGNDFKVMSSYGHIRDLKKREMSIDTKSLEPEYEIPEEKEKLVKELKANAKKACAAKSRKRQAWKSATSNTCSRRPTSMSTAVWASIPSTWTS